MKVGDTLRFEGPLATSRAEREGEAPILFVAGATGFAPIKSIVEDAFARGITRPMRLYWGVRKRADLYRAGSGRAVAARARNFRVVPVLSEPDPAGPGAAAPAWSTKPCWPTSPT